MRQVIAYSQLPRGGTPPAATGGLRPIERCVLRWRRDMVRNGDASFDNAWAHRGTCGEKVRVAAQVDAPQDESCPISACQEILCTIVRATFKRQAFKVQRFNALAGPLLCPGRGSNPHPLTRRGV